MSATNRRDWAIAEAQALLERHSVSPEQFAVAMGVVEPATRQPLSRLVPVDVAAGYLGVSVRTVAALAAEGELPVVKIGASTRYDLRELAAYVERHAVEKVTPA